MRPEGGSHAFAGRTVPSSSLRSSDGVGVDRVPMLPDGDVGVDSPSSGGGLVSLVIA